MLVTGRLLDGRAIYPIQVDHILGAVNLNTSDGSVALSDCAKTELLNEYFISVDTHGNGVLPSVQPLVTDDIFLYGIDCSEDNI